jgi:alpha-tubulin suppressor-like RCC1 family protein
MDSSTINITNITVADSSGNAIGGVVSYSSNVATFNPSNDLNHNATYTVTVGTGVKDSVGNAFGTSSSWNFSSSYPSAISSSFSSNCILLSNNKIKCWGQNNYGQLGDGSKTNSLTLVAVKSTSYNATSNSYEVISNANSIAAGLYHFCASLSDNTMKCWGYNNKGQLGTLTASANKATAVYQISSAASVPEANGGFHSCALLTDNSVKCWGQNQSGKLGNGSTTDSNYPVTVSGISNATRISVGQSHTCAVLSDNTIKCWGGNGYGQLGDGTTTNRPTPVTVSGISSATRVSGGTQHTCAVLSDNTIKCWGYNNYGQLGDGTTTQRNTPVAVSGISNATEVISRGDHTCALLSDKTMKCWGHNTYGVLGDGGTTTQRNTPVAVSGISNAIEISGHMQHTCAVLSDKNIKCWGANDYGQLGDGTTTNRSTPVTVQF